MERSGRFDRYALIALLDRGGMGSVYRARDARLDREIALKILRGPGDEEGRTRALREARAVAALDHPNVVAIYDVDEVLEPGETTPTIFIAMELVRGESLRAHVGREPADLVQRVRWLRDIAAALSCAHERGIIHRDVKPENVMIRSDGVVKVLDFGIARRANPEAGAQPNLTEKGVVLGTPRYMAPEQMLGEDLDGRADQFAWGVIAYELLSGTAPWSATSDSLQAVAEMLVHPHAPLRERAPQIPTEIAAVVERAMKRARRDRLPTMGDVVHALDDWLAGAAEVTGGTRRVRVDAPPIPGRSRQVVFAAGIFGLAVAGGTLLFSRHPTSSSPPRVPKPQPTCSARECVARTGSPSVCRADRTCAPLASEDCHVVSAPNDVGDDRTVWLGVMYPLTGPDAEAFGLRELHAVELARGEIARVMSGSNARGAGPGSARPIALVACDDAADPARAVRHLVDDVGAPAVIGFHTSQEAIDLASSTLLPKGVLAVSALNASPMLTRLPRAPGEPRLVWRTAVSAAQSALAAGAVVPRVLEPMVHARGLGTRAALRVALLRQDDAAGQGFADAFFRALEFNGRPAIENGADMQEIVFPSSREPGADAPYLAAAAKAAAFAPHVIVYVSSDETFSRVLGPLERAWPASAGYRPLYLKPAVFGPPVLAYVGSDSERRHRFFGLTSTSSSMANARFVARYNEAYDDHATRTFSPNSSYDAFYVLAYATYALGGSAVTGAALSRAFSRLVPPGDSIDVGPEGIFPALGALEAGHNVDLNGATGRLDLDAETGESPVDMAVLCVGADAHGAATDSVESGLVFDAHTHALQGTFACP